MPKQPESHSSKQDPRNSTLFEPRASFRWIYWIYLVRLLGSSPQDTENGAFRVLRRRSNQFRQIFNQHRSVQLGFSLSRSGRLDHPRPMPISPRPSAAPTAMRPRKSTLAVRRFVLNECGILDHLGHVYRASYSPFDLSVDRKIPYFGWLVGGLKVITLDLPTVRNISAFSSQKQTKRQTCCIVGRSRYVY